MKAYYTDPLAAAWMAKHFGMKFMLYLPENGYVVDNWREFFDSGQPEHEFRELDPPFYIHPDSLHLLEPQVDDLAYYNYGEACIIVSNGTKGAVSRIIQRNGIPFMYPEIEQ